MTVEEFKKILYEYPSLRTKIYSTENEVKRIEGEIAVIRSCLRVPSGMDYRSSEVSDITHSRAQECIDMYDERIGALMDEKRQAMNKARLVEECLKKLDESERGIIEARYFKHMKWDNIPYNVHLCRMTCFRKHDKAMEKLGPEFENCGLCGGRVGA